MTYLDFDLLIERHGEGFRARVLNRPDENPEVEFRLPFDEVKLENVLLRLGRTRRSSSRMPWPAVRPRSPTEAGPLPRA